MVALLSDALWGTYRVPLGTSEAFGGPVRHLWRTVEGEHLGDHYVRDH